MTNLAVSGDSGQRPPNAETANTEAAKYTETANLAVSCTHASKGL